jgi:hypothetical protein
MLMTTVAAFVLAAPVAAQEQAKPEAAQQLEQTQQEQQPGAEGQPPATTAEGDTPPPDPAMTAEEEPVGEGEAEVAEEAPPPDMKFLTEQETAQFLAEREVIGKEVVNAGDEEVGEIADLVMDEDQKLVGVVLSVGGFLGIGEKWVAVDVNQIDFPSGDQPARLLAAVTEEQLKNAPDFTTRETIEAQRAAEQAQMQQQQQMQQVPSPATAD